MTLMSAGRLGILRARAEAALPERATIRRATMAADGRGGQTLSWATVATDVPARLAAASTRVRTEMALAGKAAFLSPWTITLPAGTDVGVRDRIVIDARQFEITLVSTISYEVARRVAATEVL